MYNVAVLLDNVA